MRSCFTDTVLSSVMSHAASWNMLQGPAVVKTVVVVGAGPAVVVVAGPAVVDVAGPSVVDVA